MEKEAIREFSGKIIGWVETDNNGNQLVRNFIGNIIAKYDANMNVTRDFLGNIISRGNTAVGQLYNPNYNK